MWNHGTVFRKDYTLGYNNNKDLVDTFFKELKIYRPKWKIDAARKVNIYTIHDCVITSQQQILHG